MPTYDYHCQVCGHRFTQRQSFSDSPLTRCPECKKNKLERLFGTGGAVIFKGAGFYETDYRRPGQTDKPEDAPAETANAETKAETKPDTKSENSAKPESGDGGAAKKKGK
jgi:putative FmdB family regulatory protein